MRALTHRQSQVIEFIREFNQENGCAPSRVEIARALGVTHPSTVDSHLQALERKGYLELRHGCARYARLLKDDVPLVVAGTIAAGKPILAEEHVSTYVPRSVAECFRMKPDFFLRVRGDSMDRMGYPNDSLVAVKSRPDAESGQVVVARIEDEVTLKRFIRKDRRYVELRPESTNTCHRSTRIDLSYQEFEIAGIAVGALIGDRFSRIGHYELGASQVPRE